MASLLCREFCNAFRNIGDAVRLGCNAIGQVLCLPCRLCGVASAKIGDVLCSPFALYLMLALGLNVPPIVFAGLAAGANECKDDVVPWLVKNAVFCIINIVAALYIVSKILARSDSKQQQLLEEGTFYGTREQSCARIKQVLCDDPGVALYILVGIVYLVWTGIGTKMLHHGECGNDEIAHHLRNAVLCNHLFIALGGLGFCLSACC